MLFLRLLSSFLMSLPVYAQLYPPLYMRPVRVVDLPSAASASGIVLIVSDSSDGTCGNGSGLQVVACKSNGAGWLPQTFANVSGGGGGGSASYALTLTSATSYSVSAATHNLGSANISVSCFDGATPANRFEPGSVTVDPTTFTVTIAMYVAKSGGKCVLR